jgi:cytochrome c2
MFDNGGPRLDAWGPLAFSSRLQDMGRMGPVLCFLVLGSAAYGASRTLPLGDARRGREVFRARQCDLCHSINGEGGNTAPDLGRSVGRGFAPYRLAGLLWDHAPAMWEAMRKRNFPVPEVTERDAADLFAYFYAVQFVERRGDAEQGRRVFRARLCATCHGLTTSAKQGIRPVAEWPALEDTLDLVSAVWNRAPQMRTALDAAKVHSPQLSAAELTDLIAYLKRLPSAIHPETGSMPPSAEIGQQIYTAKGCKECHKGSNSLESRPTLYTFVDFAATLWNHPFRVPSGPAPIAEAEMEHLVSYLVSMQFFEERGDLGRGRRIYERKRCGLCHDDPSSGAPARSAMGGRMTSFGIAAALWKHGPAMLQKMRERKYAWPRFTGSEMADLSAYLHGLELKQRPAATAGPPEGSPPPKR